MVWGFVGSICSSIGSAFSSACSALGSALSSFATSIASTLGSVISSLGPVAEALGKFANAFLQGMGILRPNETTEDMGDRALQAAEKGITPEKFQNFEAYMSELRNFDIDPERSIKRSSAEKLVAGIGIGTVGMEDKFNLDRGSLNSMWLLPITNADYFTPARMETLLTSGRLGGDVFAYLEKRLSGSENQAFEKQLDIDGNTDILYEALDSAREKWAELAKQVEARNNPDSTA